MAKEGASVALLEAKPRQYVLGWDVTRLVARGNHDSVLPSVVQAATMHLQSHGVPRLFARCKEESSQLLSTVDFHTLAREQLLLGPAEKVTGDATLPPDSRYRMPQDAWPLHQLELEITPPLVRNFEGLTSLDWSKRKPNMSEIVVERDGRIVAWIGWGPKLRGRVLEIALLLHSGSKELGPVLLHHALKNLPEGCRFLARVRDYHVEALNTFQDAGFDTVAEETIMVKHASVEVAREGKRRLRVARVPSIPGIPITMNADNDNLRKHVRKGRLRPQDGIHHAHPPAWAIIYAKED